MIAIIDYQMGNLRSVQKAFEHVGYQAIVTDDVDQLKQAHRIVLPGVGAFPDAMAELRKRDFVEPIRELVQSGKPFLGICLGLQMLMDIGYEGTPTEGLKLIPGDVRKFELGREYKVPHMGWNQVRFDSDSPMLKGIEQESHFYFVHSYYVAPSDSSMVALTTNYGHDFCAAIAHENIFATQFHPEKSQAVGMQLIKNFAEWDV